MRFAEERTARRLLPLVFVLAMQILLGEPAGVMQTWAIIGGWSLLRVFRSRQKKAEAKGIAATLGVAMTASILIAAVQLLPAIDFVRDTVRTKAFDFRVVANWSTPPVRLVELILPGVLRHVAAANGSAFITTIYAFRNDAYLTEIYAGLLIVLLSAAGVLAGVRGRWLFLGTIAASITLAMGDHTPLLRVLYDSGILSSFRFPEKFLLTAAFAIAVWSAIVFDQLLDGDRRLIRWASGLAIVWLCVSIVLLVRSSNGGALGTAHYFAINCARAALIAIWLWLARTQRGRVMTATGVMLLAADLWYSTLNAVPRERREFFDPARAVAQIDASAPYRVFNEVAWLGWEGDPIVNEMFNIAQGSIAQGSAFSWVMRNSVFPELPALRGLAVAMEDDIDLTSLRNTDDFRQAFKGTRSSHFPDADEPYARMANVGWRVRMRPFDDALRQQILTDASKAVTVEVEASTRWPRYAFAGRLERTPDPSGFRYAVERNAADTSVAYIDADAFSPASGRVIRFRETANTASIDVAATGRSFLVASVTGHRYWSATIDGQPARLVATNLAFQGVEVPAGAHTINMRYRNPLVPIGAVISLVSLVALAAAAWFRVLIRTVSRGDAENTEKSTAASVSA
jgi:hypothetical protein